MITFQQEFLFQVKDELEPLLRLDWEEIEHEKSLRELNPDWGLYQVLEENDKLRIFTVRDNKTLVGYFTAVFIPSLHSKGLVQASADVIFLKREYRKGSVAIKLFKFAEACLKQDGAKVIFVATTEVNPIDPLMHRLGYKKIETRFERVL